jgi:hypothetical protein
MGLMRGGETTAAPETSANSRRVMRFAWISVGLIPVAFVVAMLIGEGLIGLQGFESGSGQTPPVAAILLAAIPAVLVAFAPAVCAIVFGFRARRHGVGVGVVPAGLGIVAVAYTVIANALPVILGM